MRTIEALKGVIRELLAAKAELELAGLHFAVERAEAALAAAAPSPAGESTPVPEVLLTALRFYARGEHYHVDDGEDFDTVSGEPQNWLCSGIDDSQTMIEDGRIARHALQGIAGSWIDGDEDGTPQPIENEVFAAAPGAQPAPNEPTLEETRWMRHVPAAHGDRGEVPAEPINSEEFIQKTNRECREWMSTKYVPEAIDKHFLISLWAWQEQERRKNQGSAPQLTGATENRIDRLETELAQARSAVPEARRSDWLSKLGFELRQDGDVWLLVSDFGGEREATLSERVLWKELLAAAPNLPAVAHDDALRDMEARKDAAYLERNQVVAALAKAFPSGVARTAIEGWSEDWHGCVYIDLPTGQASWHFHDSQAYLFDGLPPYTGAWDGHSTEEKYRRLAALRPAARNAELSEQRIDDIINAGSYRNAAGGIYATSVYAFARDILATASSADARDAARKPVVIRCSEKVKNGGSCPHHNLHCGWPQCNEEK